MFGWLPALLWILLGSIFIGGVHDMTALTASIRHKARSIAEVVRDHMSQRSYMLFLDLHLDRAGVHHRGVHRYHGRPRLSAGPRTCGWAKRRLPI